MKKLLNLTLAAVLSMAALPMVAGKDQPNKSVYIFNASNLALNFEIRTRHKQKKGSRVRVDRYMIKPSQAIAHSYPADGKLDMKNKLGLAIIPGGDIQTGNILIKISTQPNLSTVPQLVDIGQFIQQHPNDQELYLVIVGGKIPTVINTQKQYEFTGYHAIESTKQASIRAAAQQVSGSVVEENDADDNDAN